MHKPKGLIISYNIPNNVLVNDNNTTNPAINLNTRDDIIFKDIQDIAPVQSL